MVGKKTARKGAAPKKSGRAATRPKAKKAAGAKKAAPTKRATSAKKAAVRKRAKASNKGRAGSSKRKPRRSGTPVISVGDSLVLYGGEFVSIGVRDAGTTQPEGRVVDGGGEWSAETTEGIVCAIRSIASGKLVAKTKGPLEGFVLEVLHSRTFRPEFSSRRNVGGGLPSNEAARNPGWVKVRAVLREMAGRKQFVSHASGRLARELFDSLLDGWRVVKVKTRLAELQE